MSQLQVTGEAKIRDIQGPVVANSGVITALNGAASQYVRGDGTLASFPTSTGGGSSVSYYLNGSVNQGTFGGSTYYQMSKNAIVGTGTNFSASANGLIAQFITDANDPDVVSIPSGNWNVEFFMNVSASSGALASFYVEFYKYNGSTFTLLATNVATPEQLTNTTTVDAYYTSVAMPLSTMAVTDRLAIRIFVNVAGKTVTLYTEDNRLCQVVTTFSKGLASLNNLTDQSQYLTTGTSGTNFAIVSSGDTHTFNLPTASATNTGKLSNTDWSTFNAKQAALSFTTPLVNTSNTISIPAATSLVDGYLDNLDWVNFNTAYNDSIISAAVTGTTTKTLTLNQQDGGTITASWTDINTDAVTSVFGRTGAVVAASGDYTTTQVTEGTNLYYTDARSRGALSFTAGSGAYNSTTGVITIPTNTNQLTNGASFITLGSLSGGTGISYNNTTGVITSTITQYTDALARAAISLTTTGTSGAATYNSTTGVLNVPNYAPDLSGYVPTSRILTINGTAFDLSANRSWSVGTVTSVGLSSATSGVTIGSSPITTSGTITLSIATASGLQNGLLSSTDWTTFNNKQNALTNPVTGTGTTNTLPKFTGTSTVGNSNITDTGSLITLSSNVTTTGSQFVQNGFYLTNANAGATAGYTHMWGADDGIFFGLRNATGGAKFVFQSATSYNYTFPAATGTLALTSNLSAYLPLTGGTLTGALSGTSATFSGNNLSLINASGSADFVLGRANTSSGAAINLNTNGVNKWFFGLRGLVDENFYIFNQTAGVNNLILNASTGAATFSSSVTATNAVFERANDSGSILRIGNAGSTYFDFSRSAATGALLIQGNQTGNNNIILAPTSGNVGIGTSSPTRILHLSAAGSNCAIRIDNSVSGRPVILSYDDSQNLTLLNSSDSGYFAYVNGTGSGTERMRITSGGDLCLGATTSNGYMLRVTGYANIGGNLVVNGDTTIGGLAGSGSRAVIASSTGVLSAPVSDISVKQNIKPIGYGLNEISKMNPVWFDFIDEYKNYGEGRQNGNIAQEMAEIIPEAVFTTPSTGKMGINYDQMHAVYIKAIQELKLEIEELKALINK